MFSLDNKIKIKGLECELPVVLAPMAGITHYPFRKLCRKFGAGLYVSEMVTAHTLVAGDKKTLKIADFGPDEPIKSIQLYGVDPAVIGQAVQRLVNEVKVDHIDLNFGCPVRKVTRKGGGAAIPLKPKLFAKIIQAAVANAGAIPVTTKFRKGINEQYLTYLNAGKIAQEEGCSAIGLHARTAAQLYSGQADWIAIKELKLHVQHIPVFGNGDIWCANDAVKMMQETGCDGVIIGRGCLGRPWLFRELAQTLMGEELSPAPDLQMVLSIMREHLQYLCEWFEPSLALRSFRKHIMWYLQSFSSYQMLRAKLFTASTFQEFESILETIEFNEQAPDTWLKPMHEKHLRTQQVALPENYLLNLNDAVVPDIAAESAISGG